MLRLISLIQLLKLVNSEFFIGRIPYGPSEYNKLNGFMTVRSAILICETDIDCAGFTYKGPIWDLESQYKIYFFNFIISMINQDINNADWATYAVDRKFKLLKNSVFPAIDDNFFIESSANSVTLTKQAEEMCLQISDCVAIALSNDGKMRIYNSTKMSSLVKDENWTTLLHLRAINGKIMFPNEFEKIDYSCPFVREPHYDFEENIPFANPLPRHKCDLTENEFVEKFVRTGTPVILEGCSGYKWMEKYDFSLKNIVETYHDNSTKPPNYVPLKAPSGFTHNATPNDFVISNDDVMAYYYHGFVRMFELLRNNPLCEALNNTCQVLKNVPKPNPIPIDLYKILNYENPMNWIIYSQKLTGSYLHVDPDVTGAWNYVINGYKYWVVFPAGVDLVDVSCRFSNEEDVYATLSWFRNVLPQLRNKKFYGKPLWEGIQAPNEVIYLPHDMIHTVLNLEDNVAITENFLFVDAISDLIKHVVFDEIPIWRPGWVDNLWKKLYFSKYLQSQDRKSMRLIYNQVTQMLNNLPNAQYICESIEYGAMYQWRSKYGKNPQTKFLQELMSKYFP